MRQLLRKIGCWMSGHRWRPEATRDLWTDSDVFDWADDRQPEIECECLRCGMKRSAWLAEKEKQNDAQ